MNFSEASNTGDASAPGGYANTGVHIGDINLTTGAPVRTRYREQVRRIAPQRLVGREAELAELAEFSTSPDTAGKYQWWRAKAWSGKSALMSWFVLHPPRDVRIVSFFITARWASQNNRQAYIDNVMGQLLTILGRPMPPYLSEFTQDTHLLGLLTEAAEICQGRGEKFVLLVDGLDEDRGVTTGPDAHSIAQLLPADPPAGMRVIVAGRPNPPIPTDVPDQHPLRDPAIVRLLSQSPEAQAEQAAMERELKNLLSGSLAEQDLLGLLTSAGGGLTALDLSELTGWSTWEVDDHLRTVTGRTFAQRGSHYSPGVRPNVFVLGHEELQVTARTMLGPARLDGYRQRLHTWADQYRARRWPADSPEYLLVGYHNLLSETNDLERMVSCATDTDRHDRLLDVSGGDAAAMIEVKAAQKALLEQERPDLVALLRVAWHRDHLTTRNTNIPTALPALWTMLGHAERASTLATSIPDPAKQAKALIRTVKAAAHVGGVQLAAEFASSIGADKERRSALRILIDAATCADDVSRILEIISSENILAHLSDADLRHTGSLGILTKKAIDHGLLEQLRQAASPAVSIALPLAHVTLSLLSAEPPQTDPEKTAFLLDQVIDHAPEINDHRLRSTLLISLFAITTNVPADASRDRANLLATAATRSAREVIAPDERGGLLARLAVVSACKGESRAALQLFSEAIGVVEGASQISHRHLGVTNVVKALGGDDPDRNPILHFHPDDVWTESLPKLPLRTIAQTLSSELLHRMVSRTVSFIISTAAAGDRDDMLVRLATALKVADQSRLATKVAGRITDPRHRIRAAFSLGNERLAHQAVAAMNAIADPEDRIRALLSAAGRGRKAHDPDWISALVAQIVTEATAAAHDITNQEQRDYFLFKTATTASLNRDLTQERETIISIEDPGTKVDALLALAHAAAKRTGRDNSAQKASDLASEAIRLASGIPDETLRDPLLNRAIRSVSHAAALSFREPFPAHLFGAERWPSQLITIIDSESAETLLKEAFRATAAFSSRELQTTALELLAATAHKVDLFDLTLEIARSIHGTEARCTTMQSIAALSEPDRAKRLLTEAIEVAHTASDREQRDSLLAALTKSAATNGQVAEGETAARALSSATRQRQAFSLLSNAALKEFDIDAVIRLTDAAMEAAHTISDHVEKCREMAAVIDSAIHELNPIGYFEGYELYLEPDFLTYRPEPRANFVATLVQSVGQDRVAELVEHYENLAQAIDDTHEQSRTLVLVGYAALDAGEIDRAGRLAALAENIARFDLDPVRRSRELVTVARAAWTAGQSDLTARLLDDAMETALTIPDSQLRIRTLISVATLMGQAGQRSRALALVNDVHLTAQQNLSTEDLQPVLETISATLAAMGGPESLDLAAATARGILASVIRGRTLVVVATEAYRANENRRAALMITRAERIARTTSRDLRTEVATTVVRQLAHTVDVLSSLGQHGRAAELLSRMERLTRYAATPVEEGHLVNLVVEAAARIGDFARAEALSRRNTTELQHSWALRSMAEAAARAGELRQAARIASSIPNAQQRSTALCSVVESMARAGDTDEAEQLAQSITTQPLQAQALRSVVLAVAPLNPGRAAALLERMTVEDISHPRSRSTVLTHMAAAALAYGDAVRAKRWLRQAMETAQTIGDVHDRSRTLVSLVQSLARTPSDHPVLASFTQDLISSIPSTEHRARALLAAVDAYGSTTWTRELAFAIEGQRRQVALLTMLARKSDPSEQKPTMGRVITSVPWLASLEAVAEMWPDLVPAVTDDFVSAVHRDADAARRHV